MSEIIGLDDIVGMDRGQWGSPEVAGVSAGLLNAEDLPRGWVGIPAVPALVAGDVREIQCDVQREMRPDRLVLQSAGGIFSRVRDVKVGTVSLNASPNPIPAGCFAPESVGVSIRATMTATPAIGIQLLVELDAGAGEVEWVPQGGFFGPQAAAGRSAEGQVGAIVGAAEDPSDPAAQQPAAIIPGAGAVYAKALPQSFVGTPRVTFADPGETQYIQVPVQRDFRPDRFLLPLAYSPADWLIHDIRIGTISLNASLNPVPGSAWQSIVFGTRSRPQVTTTPALGITMRVQRNPLAVGGGVFHAAFFGPSRIPT